ncbi:MAG: NfeD family protein [Clostridia bacterium]
MAEFFGFVENIDVLPAIFLIVGLVLLIIEACLPNFGIVGIMGIICALIGIFMTAETLLQGIVMFLILVAFVAIVFAITIHVATKGRLSKKLIIRDTQSTDNGYIGVKDMSAYIGKTGKALTILRPSGTGMFDGEKLDVVTNGGFIEEGKKIIIDTVEGIRIVVKEYKGE